MIESARTPERRVQGQGICPVCDFCVKTSNQGTNCVSTSTSNEFSHSFRRASDSSTSFPLAVTSSSLVPTSASNESHTRSERQPATSLTLVPKPSLITRADRTSGREMLCSPELHQTTRDTRIQQRSAAMFAVLLLCVQARNCSRSNQTTGCAHTWMSHHVI